MISMQLLFLFQRVYSVIRIHTMITILRYALGDLYMDMIRERVLTVGQYICDTHATVRDTARRFGISKSTVHKDMTQKLPEFDPTIYAVVREILEQNKAERHLRGGEATKIKYRIIREKAADESKNDEFFKR